MPFIYELLKRPHTPDKQPESSAIRLTRAAELLRPIWWERSTVDPLLDVGVFRLTDPRPKARSAMHLLLDYDAEIARLKTEGKTDVQPLMHQHDRVARYITGFRPFMDDRVLELHIPPRRETRTLPSDVPWSMKQLAGWIEAFNFYYPDRPIRFLLGRTALDIRKRAPAYGFDMVEPDAIPHTDHIDLLEHMVQNPHLDFGSLTKQPVWLVFTHTKSFRRAHGVSGHKDRIMTAGGHVLTLPHRDNGWTLWLQGNQNGSGISESDAQVFRGAVQHAISAAYTAGKDVRIRIPDVSPFRPFLDRARRTDGVQTLYSLLGTPVRRYGYPDGDTLSAHISDL